MAPKTRELDNATVNNHNQEIIRPHNLLPQPIMPFGIVAYALMLFSWTTFVETAVHKKEKKKRVIRTVKCDKE